MNGRFVGSLVLGLGAVLSSTAHAEQRDIFEPEPEIPRHRLVHSGFGAARVNPVGLFAQANLQYRYRFYDGADIARDNYLAIGLIPTLSPAFGRLGVQGDFQPALPLRLTASYERGYYFGTFNLFQSFPGIGSDFSDTTVEARGEAGENYKTSFAQATLGALVQLKFGKIVVRTNVRGVYFDADTENGDKVFYDQFFDVLAPAKGWVVFNDLDAMYELGPGRFIGARYFLASPRYGDDELAPGDDPKTDNSIRRLGLLFAWRFSEEDGSKFYTPTLLASAQWHLRHRWRTGEDVSQGVPLVFVGFAWAGDLWSKK